MKIKRKGQSVQELMGFKSFTEYGLATNRGELLFFSVAPTNISVLSQTNVGIKIHHLMMVLSTIPDIEIVCTDASEYTRTIGAHTAMRHPVPFRTGCFFKC